MSLSDNGIYIDDVAAAAVRTVKAYTDLVDAGELHISNERGISIFETMSRINTCLRIYCDRDYWSEENERLLNTIDETMVAFQKSVVEQLRTAEPSAPAMAM